MVVVQTTGHTGNKWELTEISFLANSNKDQSSPPTARQKHSGSICPNATHLKLSTEDFRHV